MKIVILAGGSGVRLWPLSRQECPKQYANLPGMSETLFLQAFKRSLTLAGTNDIFVVAEGRFTDNILNDISTLGIKYDEKNIIIQPETKNTLPAVYAAVHKIRKTADELVVVLPADHVIEKIDEFADAIRESVPLAEDAIITFGIRPGGPNTGYGYILPGKKIKNGYSVSDFKEKPGYEEAIEYIKEGYLWNAGIFMFKTDVFSDEVKKYCQDIYDAFQDNSDVESAYADIQSGISVDYGIMEKSHRAYVVPVDIGWDDIGSFDSFYKVLDKDKKGNISGNENVLINTENTLIHQPEGKKVVTVGLRDVIIIDTDDVLLVCKKGESQRVREATEIIKQKMIDEREEDN